MKNIYFLLIPTLLYSLCAFANNNSGWAALACAQICVDEEIYIDCENSAVQLDGTCSSGDISSISWATTNGNIISGANTLTPTVDAEGTYTLTLTSSDGCQVTANTLVSNNLDVLNLESILSYAQDLSDIWGYTDAAGNEYALVGTVSGVSIVDITDTSNPTEVQFVSIAGLSSIWWDLKTCGDYAYFITEDANPPGLNIIDLSNLPNSAPVSTTDLGIGYTDSHNIFIDENCKGYLFGASSGAGNGTIIIDIASNPTNPSVLGIYNTEYVHDGFVQNDIMYTAEIYAGQLAIVDVSNPANPVVLGSVTSPNNYAHAVWVTPDNTTAFVLDEVNNAVVAVYDVTDPSNIILLDTWNDGTGAIMHNAFWVDGGFLSVSHYTSGTTILDVSVPNVVVPVGTYDTSPFSGGGFAGQWGNYPYFPSGTIVASDTEEGLFILSTNYIPASHLEGTITDACTGQAIPNATIDILGVSDEEVNSNFSGYYITGVPKCGTYNVSISASGYTSQTISFALNSDEIRTLSVGLVPIGSSCCDADAGDLAAPSGEILPLSFCEGSDIGAFTNNYTSIFETNPGTGYDYAFVATLGNNIVDFNTSGDFDFSSFTAGTYNIYGFSYAATNSLNVTAYLSNQSTLTGIQNDINNSNICADIENLYGNNSAATVSINTCNDYANCVGITDFYVSAKILLEARWDGSSMNTDVASLSIMPNNQPYGTAPWNYTGTENVALVTNNMVDWVMVCLRDASGNLLFKQAAVLDENGALLNLDGGECIVFPGANIAGQYYVSVHHRGHLSVMSSQPVNNGDLYDFTIAETQAMGIQQLKLVNGAWVLFGGDFDNSRVVNNLDFNMWGQNSAAVFQYLPFDIDGNGVINNADYNIWTLNSSKVGLPSLTDDMQ